MRTVAPIRSQMCSCGCGLPVYARGLAKNCYERARYNRTITVRPYRVSLPMDDETTVIACTRCGVEKPAREFTRHSGYRRNRTCRACKVEISRANAAVVKPGHPRWVTKRNGILKRRYRMTVEDYEILLDQQKGVCAICGTDLRDVLGSGWKGAHIDHDRACCPGRNSCGKCVRGILCGRCNAYLAWAEAVSIVRIAQYLDGSGALAIKDPAGQRTGANPPLSSRRARRSDGAGGGSSLDLTPP